MRVICVGCEKMCEERPACEGGYKFATFDEKGTLVGRCEFTVGESDELKRGMTIDEVEAILKQK